ncbi:hypothetical protein LH23_20575 [Cedecea neteri]|uniref:Sulfatase N-terminal domain-containing protein n=2 Tax=Cedecea neteri TaxID=158822 RepID=A0AAN0S7E8_9ENTR|nr:hypothetical protein LH23_20575 [Cedecea neteri]
MAVFVFVSFKIAKNKKTFDNHFISIMFFALLLTANQTVFFSNVISSIKDLSQGDGSKVENHYKSLNPEVSERYNYVFIYAESLERTFQSLGGKNYTPRLSEIADKNIEFTNVQQTPGMGWTMAGIVNTQCAIPLVLAQGNSGNSISHFLRGADCVATWFEKKNYITEFIRGSDKEFAGGDKFFAQHGWINQHDKQYFLDNNLASQEQISGWGVHDDVLLEHAYNEFEKFSISGKPFLLSLLTVNTHPPSGTFLQTCEEKISNHFDNDMLRSVACSDYLLSDFIAKISQSKWFDKTIIVLVSDHYMMENDASKILTANEDSRKNRFVIIKKGIVPQKNNSLGSLLDVWPTVFDIAGATNPEFGFGISLLSENPSPYIADFSSKREIKDYLNFSSKLWRLPSINDRMWYSSGKLNIDDQKFNLPLYATLDSSGNFQSIYFDAFAKNAPLLAMENKNIFYADLCKNLNVRSNDVCAYNISKDTSTQFFIDSKGIHHRSDIKRPSALFSNNLIGISTGPFTVETGVSSGNDGNILKRGITFIGGHDGFNLSKTLSFDTCMGEVVDEKKVHKIYQRSNKNLIFASNDSIFCGDVNALQSISSVLRQKEINHVTTRQQIIGVYSGGEIDFVIGLPELPLDAFIEKSNNKIIRMCELFFDC